MRSGGSTSAAAPCRGTPRRLRRRREEQLAERHDDHASDLDEGRGPVLETCTSTAKSVPTMLPGWKVTFYSARLSKTTSPDVSEANHVRTFSYKAIKALTSANDLYIRIEKADQSFLTGFGTAVESCDANNKITQYYSVRNRTGVEGKNVLASTFYFHGGNYLHGAGTYRVDAYVKTLDGKWHLVDRLSGLKITP